MSNTYDLVQATYSAALGGVVGYLDPRSYGRKFKLISLSAPANSQLGIYRGYIPNFSGQLVNIFPADVRTYTAESDGPPIDIRPGEAAAFLWTAGSVAPGTTATASINSEVY